MTVSWGGLFRGLRVWGGFVACECVNLYVQTGNRWIFVVSFHLKVCCGVINL